MEESPHQSSASPFRSPEDKLHLSNIQFLAAIDCALGVTSLIFNCRQLVLVITGFPKGHASNEEKSGEDAATHARLSLAAVASVCLTLTQLLLACSVMASLSDIYGVYRKRRIVVGMWVGWSGVLLVVLSVCAFGIKRFDDVGDKFYLFILLTEVLFRIVVIYYTCIFYLCKFNGS